MTNFQYKLDKYYNKFSNTDQIFKKIKYISKILYYKKFIIDQTGGGMLGNKTIEIENILIMIPIIINKIKLLNNINSLVLKHDNLIKYYDSSFSTYNKNTMDIIDYYNNIIKNIKN